MNAGTFIIVESIVIGVLFIIWKTMCLIEWNLKYNPKPVKGSRLDRNRDFYD